ncbi:DUF3299 domain-containing protein [Kiritimatiellaeota bacterium B1221]|nr:DUF3299 domain-containing protein [Kiritimatiellaeota bacterium B1221]
MKLPKNTYFILSAVLLIGIAFTLWQLSKIPAVRPPEKVDFENLPAPEGLIDFDMLEQTVPDENYEPVYPAELDKLDKKNVVMRGYMTPYNDLENLQVFMVLGFPTGCNFCAPPAVNQVVLVRQPEGKENYPYIDGPIEVSGTLKLWRKESTDPAHKEDYFLYVLESESVSKLDPRLFKPSPQEHRVN